jgi:hypothetical protein
MIYKAAFFPLQAIYRLRRPDRIVRLFPMLCVQAYLTFSVLLFAFGPWRWPVSNPVTLYLFLILAQLALWFGYITYSYERPMTYIGRLSWSRLFRFALVLSLLWIIPNFIMRLGLATFEPSTIYSKIIIGFSDPGIAYKQRVESMTMLGSTSLLFFLTLIVAPLLQLLLPIGITYWQRLPKWHKILLVAFILFDILSWTASGTNKGIADTFLLVPFFIIAGNPSIITRIRVSHILRTLFILLVGFYGLFTFFSKGQLGRSGGISISMYDASAGIYADKGNFLIRALPESAREGAIAFTSYFTQGYYGLSLSLEEPFVWSYGLGHAYYLASWYKRVNPAADIGQLTYPGRIEAKGWSYFGRWASIYPWLASDVTFPGAIIIMFVIGRLFALVWQDILFGKNPIALSLFGMLLIVLFYAPANNQIFGFPISGLAFWAIFVWWRRTRRDVIKVGYCANVPEVDGQTKGEHPQVACSRSPETLTKQFTGIDRG